MIGIKIPWQVFACAGLLLTIGGWGELRHWQGKQEVQGKWDAAVERGKVIVADLKKKRVIVNTVVETVYQDKIKVVREKGDVIVKQVPMFVPQGSCDLPGGFRLLHDAAAIGAIPDATAIPDAAAVPAETVATTVAENYTTCNQVREQLMGLQDWVQKQADVSAQTCKELKGNCS